MAPLVDYSDSEEDDTTGPIQEHKGSMPNGVKRKRGVESATGRVTGKKRASATVEVPPLPSSFHDLYASASRISTHDDPKLHGGRKRAVPHIEGQWATHIYLECKRIPLDLVSCCYFYDIRTGYCICYRPQS